MMESGAFDPAVMGSIVFLFGLSVGSFLNVCIRRIPSEEKLSIVRPRSRCPACKTSIKPYDNIPVLSYLLLGGRCRSCRARISAIYPVVELLTGGLFFACFRAFGLSLGFVKWSVFSALLIVLIFTDILERILPDAVNFSGLAFGLGLSLVVATGDGGALWLARRVFAFPPPEAALSFTDAVFGALLGSGLLWVVSEGYFRLRGKEGMGLGDLKMMAMVGAFLGPQRTLLTIFAGSLLGSVVGLLFIVLFRKGSQYELPFGTFLGVAALLVMFAGTPVLAWYQSLF